MNKTLRNTVATGLAAAGLVVSAGASSALGATLNMSGASFPQVPYRDFCATGGDCNYAGGGSGTGIRNLVNGVNTLVGSDAPLTPDQQSQLGATPVYVPTLLGAISVPVNVSGVTGNRLKLTGKQIGDIFSGSITNWKQLRTGINAKQPLPNAAITVCVRSDGSGTSFGFSRYLGKVSKNFLTSVGGGGSQTPPWSAPVVVGKRTKRVTQYILPTPKTISAAGEIPASSIKKDLTVDFSASPVPGSYPIVITTWLVGSTNSKNKGQVGDAQRVANFFLAAPQQAKLTSFGFAPLPATVLAAAKKNIANIQ